MSEKYPEYEAGSMIPISKRRCNVVYCLDCGMEFLLGEKGYKNHRIAIRKKETLIDRTRPMSNYEEQMQVRIEMAHASGKIKQ